MPRNMMVVAGPSSLSMAIGMPNLLHTISMVSVTRSRCAVRVDQPGESPQEMDQVCSLVCGHDQVKGRKKLV